MTGKIKKHHKYFTISIALLSLALIVVLSGTNKKAFKGSLTPETVDQPSQQHGSAPAVTPAMCQNIAQWNLQGTLSGAVQSGATTSQEIIACQQQYSHIWRAIHNPPNIQICQSIATWSQQGMLSANLTNISAWDEYFICQVAYPELGL